MAYITNIYFKAQTTMTEIEKLRLQICILINWFTKNYHTKAVQLIIQLAVYRVVLLSIGFKFSIHSGHCY